MVEGTYGGVITPLLTPLGDDERVHEPSLRRLVDYQLDNGVRGLWASGTTAEFTALRDSERATSIEIVADQVAGRVPVIANISMPGTELTIDFGLRVAGKVSAVAATPPYYYPHSQREIGDHFRRIQDALDVPVWVYNIPQMHKTPVTPALMATLAAEGVVEGVKDSSGSVELLAQLHAMRAERGFELVSTMGTTHLATRAFGLGSQGIVPGLANAVPAVFSRAWDAGVTGDREAMRASDDQIVAASRLQELAGDGASVQGSIYAGLKAALVALRIFDTYHVTGPFRALTAKEREPLAGILSGLDLAPG